MNDLLFVTGIFLIAFVVRRMVLRKEPSVTASGAIVMGYGIFLYGAFNHFSLLAPYGKVLAAILLSTWLFIAASIIRSIYDQSFKKLHLGDPVNALGIGTWIAGTSVMGNVLTQFFPGWLLILRVLTVLNAVLWLYYMSVFVRSLRTILYTEAMNRVHGVILLSTVSTQSLVILFFNVFHGAVPNGLNMLMISFGIVLYIVGLYTMFRRFRHLHRWRLAEDWLPSNCIIHGAMSITGLAAATTGAIHANIILAIWIWVLIWFIIVESMEICRLVIRIKKYGAVKGFGEYHVTQWSRIFTFGMFYAFTVAFPFTNAGILNTVRSVILEAGPWAVLILLVNEILLFLKEKGKYHLGVRLNEKKT